ncbi:unnamed protein product [Chrysoparadoxa australica]
MGLAGLDAQVRWAGEDFHKAKMRIRLEAAKHPDESASTMEGVNVLHQDETIYGLLLVDLAEGQEDAVEAWRKFGWELSVELDISKSHGAARNEAQSNGSGKAMPQESSLCRDVGGESSARDRDVLSRSCSNVCLVDEASSDEYHRIGKELLEREGVAGKGALAYVLQASFSVPRQCLGLPLVLQAVVCPNTPEEEPALRDLPGHASGVADDAAGFSATVQRLFERSRVVPARPLREVSVPVTVVRCINISSSTAVLARGETLFNIEVENCHPFLPLMLVDTEVHLGATIRTGKAHGAMSPSRNLHKMDQGVLLPLGRQAVKGMGDAFNHVWEVPSLVAAEPDHLAATATPKTASLPCMLHASAARLVISV